MSAMIETDARPVYDFEIADDGRIRACWWDAEHTWRDAETIGRVEWDGMTAIPCIYKTFPTTADEADAIREAVAGWARGF